MSRIAVRIREEALSAPQKLERIKQAVGSGQLRDRLSSALGISAAQVSLRDAPIKGLSIHVSLTSDISQQFQKFKDAENQLILKDSPLKANLASILNVPKEDLVIRLQAVEKYVIKVAIKDESLEAKEINRRISDAVAILKSTAPSQLKTTIASIMRVPESSVVVFLQKARTVSVLFHVEIVDPSLPALRIASLLSSAKKALDKRDHPLRISIARDLKVDPAAIKISMTKVRVIDLLPSAAMFFGTLQKIVEEDKERYKKLLPPSMTFEGGIASFARKIYDSCASVSLIPIDKMETSDPSKPFAARLVEMIGEAEERNRKTERELTVIETVGKYPLYPFTIPSFRRVVIETITALREDAPGMHLNPKNVWNLALGSLGPTDTDDEVKAHPLFPAWHEITDTYIKQRSSIPTSILLEPLVERALWYFYYNFEERNIQETQRIVQRIENLSKELLGQVFVGESKMRIAGPGGRTIEKPYPEATNAYIELDANRRKMEQEIDRLTQFLASGDPDQEKIRTARRKLDQWTAELSEIKTEIAQYESNPVFMQYLAKFKEKQDLDKWYFDTFAKKGLKETRNRPKIKRVISTFLSYADQRMNEIFEAEYSLRTDKTMRGYFIDRITDLEKESAIDKDRVSDWLADLSLFSSWVRALQRSGQTLERKKEALSTRIEYEDVRAMRSAFLRELLVHPLTI